VVRAGSPAMAAMSVYLWCIGLLPVWPLTAGV